MNGVGRVFSYCRWVASNPFSALKPSSLWHPVTGCTFQSYSECSHVQPPGELRWCVWSGGLPENVATRCLSICPDDFLQADNVCAGPGERDQKQQWQAETAGDPRPGSDPLRNIDAVPFSKCLRKIWWAPGWLHMVYHPIMTYSNDLKWECRHRGDSCASTSSSFCVKISLFRFVRSNSSFGSKLWVDQWFIMNPYWLLVFLPGSLGACFRAKPGRSGSLLTGLEACAFACGTPCAFRGQLHIQNIQGTHPWFRARSQLSTASRKIYRWSLVLENSCRGSMRLWGQRLVNL